MSLSEKQRQQVAALAAELGVNAAELEAEAEDMAKQTGGDVAQGAAKPASEVKIFAYHLPFMTVGEVRKSIGQEPGGVPDSDLPTGEWLAKHGGTTQSSTGAVSATDQPAE